MIEVIGRTLLCALICHLSVAEEMTEESKGAGQDAIKPSWYEVDLWSKAVSSEVWVNDIPVGFVNLKEGALYSSEFGHQFLVPGKNTIEIRTPATKYPDGGEVSEKLTEVFEDFKVTTRIVKRTEGERTGTEHGQTLLKVEKSSFTEGEKKTNEITHTMAVGELDVVKKDWAWRKKAETLTEKDFLSLIKLLRELQEALKAGKD